MGRRGPKPTKAEAIARAALELFVEHGVHGASTRAIARRAGTTEGNLYRYFASKQELTRHVIASCLLGFGEHIARALDGVAGPRERLRVFVQAYVEYAATHPLEYALINQVHALQLTGVPEEILRPRRILMDLLSDGLAAGVFVGRDPRLLGPFLAGGLARAIQVLTARGERLDSSPVVETLGEIVEQGVGIASQVVPRPPARAAGSG